MSFIVVCLLPGGQFVCHKTSVAESGFVVEVGWRICGGDENVERGLTRKSLWAFSPLWVRYAKSKMLMHFVEPVEALNL
jgi:hypothetical protein